MARFIILVFLLSTHLSGSASQQYSAYVDSLIYKIGGLNEDTGKVQALIQITDSLNEINYDKAIYYGTKALNLSKKLNYEEGISHSLYYLGVTYIYKADYESAMRTFFEKNEFDKKRNRLKSVANNLIYIGNIYYHVNEYEKAHEYYKKSLQIFLELNNPDGLSIVYNNLGNIFEAFKQPEKSEENYRHSISLNKQMGDYRGLSITYNNLGNLYYKHYKDSLALNYFYNAISYLEKFNNPGTTTLVFQNIGDYYLWANNYDSAYYYLNKAYDIAKSYDLPYYIKDISLSLSKIYVRNNNYQKAYEFQVIYKDLNDSIFNLNNSAKLKLMEYQYEQEKKEIEQNLLQLKQQKKTKTIIWLFIIAFVISASITVSYIITQKGKIREAILTKENIKLETARLKEQLEYRNKKIVLMTMNLFERNELINNVVNKLKNILPKTKKINYPDIEEVIRDLKSNYQENILKEFEYRFNKVHVNFYKNIKNDFDNLTSNELRLCAFLKMNMSTKDIASLTHQSINSIEVARTRLRKKLKLSNAEIDLVSFLTRY